MAPFYGHVDVHVLYYLFNNNINLFLLKVKVLVTQLCLTLCDSMGCNPPRLLYLWNSSGKNTGVGCHVLLQEVFLTQGSNLYLPHWHAVSLPLSHLEARPETFSQFSSVQFSRSVVSDSLQTYGL